MINENHNFGFARLSGREILIRTIGESVQKPSMTAKRKRRDSMRGAKGSQGWESHK